MCSDAEAEGSAPMKFCRLVFLTSVFALLAGAVQAGELRAPEAQSVRLGPFNGVGYSIEEGGRVRIVVALAEGDTGSPLRVEAVLAPGERVVLTAIGAKAGPKLTLQVTASGTVDFVGSKIIN
jgi:hypothetical protein